MAGKRTSSSPGPTLPSERAFVVHFHSTARPGPSLAGRVEHLASGRIGHFASRRGLLAFFAQFLAPAEPTAFGDQPRKGTMP